MIRTVCPSICGDYIDIYICSKYIIIAFSLSVDHRRQTSRAPTVLQIIPKKKTENIPLEHNIWVSQGKGNVQVFTGLVLDSNEQPASNYSPTQIEFGGLGLYGEYQKAPHESKIKK
jgi:hypothetical protein